MPGGPSIEAATTRKFWHMPPWSLASFGEDIGAMTALVDRALALNPNYARGWGISALLRLWADQPDLAVQHVEYSAAAQPAR